MRVTLPSVISGLVHTLGLGGLGMWAFEAARIEVFVAPGIAITARFAPEGERAEEFVALDVVERKTELEPQKVEVEQAVIDKPPELFEVSDVPATVFVPPAFAVKSEDEPDELVEEPPTTLRPRKVAAPTTTEVAAVPLEFQSADVTGAVDQPARPFYQPAWTYPPDAVLAGVFDREVRIRARVNVEGRVAWAVVERSSGWPSIDEEALRAIRLWRFHPAVSDGVPVEFDYRALIEFGRRG